MRSEHASNGLRPEIGLFSAVTLVVANMIGTGVFTTSGFIMKELADPSAMLLCWVVGGLFALSGALCYGELGARFPLAGGEYVYLRESYGRVMAFLSGWISLIIGFSAPIAAASIAFATYVGMMGTDAQRASMNTPLFSSTWIVVSPATILACSAIALFSLVHSHSLRFGSRVQNVLTAFKFLLIVSFVAAAFIFGQGTLAHFDPFPRSGSLFSSQFAVALIFVSFAYSGWNAAAYIGSEIQNPGRNIPLALVGGTLLVMVLYLLLNVVYLYALAPIQMSGVVEIGARAAAALFGEPGSRLVAGAIAVGLLSLISAMILAGPRVYYAMARDGVFFRLFGRVTKSHQTPGYSILLQAVIAIAMVLTASFEKLLFYIGFTLSLFTMFTVAGLFILRKRQPQAHLTYRTWGYPLTPGIFITGNLWIICYSVFSKPVMALFGVGTIVIGLLVYALFSYGRIRNELREKEETD